MVNMTISQVSGHTNNRKRGIKNKTKHESTKLRGTCIAFTKTEHKTECRTDREILGTLSHLTFSNLEQR